MDSPSITEQAERPYISTGHLPEPETVQRLVSEAHRPFNSNTDGHNSQVYPALGRVPSDLFGVRIVGTSGSVCAAGDIGHEFSIMSVSKPFVFALVCETIGPDEARDKLGANATGRVAGGAEGGESAVTDIAAKSRLVGCTRTLSGGSARSTPTPLTLLGSISRRIT